MKHLLVIVSFMFISACAPLPGAIQKHEDGHIVMEPAWIYNSSMKVALDWHPNYRDNVVLLVMLANTYDSYVETLTLSINGETVTLKPMYSDYTSSKSVEIGSYNGVVFANENVEFYHGHTTYESSTVWSRGVFIVSVGMVEKMIVADSVIFNMDGYGGEFSTEAFTTAKPAFKVFLKELKGEWL